MKYTTFIFDMDGVIIDSEPLWRKSQKNVLENYGVTIEYADCEKHTMGQRIDRIAQIWCEMHSLSINPKDLEKEILEKVSQNIIDFGVAHKGLYELLDYLKKSNFKIGLATSSSWMIINAVLDKLNIRTYFDQICSADDEPYGKPHPAVYLKTAQKLNALQSESIVLEDSVTGMISAKAASMKTIIFSEDYLHPKFTIADSKCNSLLTVIKEIEKMNL
jgi:mannitol-1-/sugar-/sorbitol-6-/2-deoxyglucose-6-phosphatase